MCCSGVTSLTMAKREAANTDGPPPMTLKMGAIQIIWIGKTWGSRPDKTRSVIPFTVVATIELARDLGLYRHTN